MLVANKGCRGKRKLADRWGDTMYTVIASKPALHVYRIRDDLGNEKVVHRNLLLEVNFLPLSEKLDGSSVEDAEGNADAVGDEPHSVPAVLSDTMSVHPLDEALSSLDADGGARTSSWVSQHHSDVTAGPAEDLTEDPGLVQSPSDSPPEHGLTDVSSHTYISSSTQPHIPVSQTTHTTFTSHF